MIGHLCASNQELVAALAVRHQSNQTNKDTSLLYFTYSRHSLLADPDLCTPSAHPLSTGVKVGNLGVVV